MADKLHNATADRATALCELAAVLPGQVALPGDPGWDDLRLGWVRSVDQQPSAVVTANDDEDVVAAVHWAATSGFSVSAQPVGHGATTAVDGTVLLRTRRLSEITLDLEHGTARVGAGVKWGEFLTALNGLGVTGLAGSSPDTSVVGYTLGGGLSWFGRKYGLAAYSVLAVDLVDPTGRPRRATHTTNPDLFWAIRGGGGDFGIVTSMDIQLHPAPHVYGGRLLWPAAMARPVLQAFSHITDTAPDELTMWAELLRFPPLPAIPALLRGGSFVAVDLTFLGSAEKAEALLAPLRALAAPQQDTLGTVELADLGGICAEPVDPLPVSEQTGLLSGLDDAAITALLDAVQDGPDFVLDVVQVRHLGGAFARASAADGPAGAITEPYMLAALAVPATPEVAVRIQQTFAAVTRAMSTWLTGRTPFNFLGADVDPTRAITGAALTRLSAVKAATDPDGVIRSNRPIPVRRVIAVTGATGAQGGALIRAILRHPESGLVPRAILRNANSAAAYRLAALGVEMVRADLDDRDSLAAAFEGAHGAFCLTNFWEHFDADREQAQAANLAAAASTAGVSHAIWSTLEDTRTWMPLPDERMPTLQGKYKVPHMDNKAESDRLFIEAGVPTTFLIASFYWENLINLGMGPQRGADGVQELTLPLANSALPGIAVADIGASAYEIFRAGPPATEERIGIAGDHLTGHELADALGLALDEEVRYRPLTAAAFRALGFPGADDMGNMFQFVAEFNADNLALRPLASSRARHSGLQDFTTWLAVNATAIPLAPAG
ncbi:MAG TPA: NmrA family NAD(P)-binding protein [Actinophytocola sp.]|uniref:NmrA family NAD(P)-binding protein n=1 Tax=Actinophytocola sp. TaxID=1872138 RepID=UPI002DBD913A|nr:NmrA family NAD(P)-binding protein [Actinophytocola sp.]HEU5473773.1 NmrA family NAD(P)-binding protein [Actinophytocola sp.]